MERTAEVFEVSPFSLLKFIFSGFQNRRSVRHSFEEHWPSFRSFRVAPYFSLQWARFSTYTLVKWVRDDARYVDWSLQSMSPEGRSAYDQHNKKQRNRCRTAFYPHDGKIEFGAFLLALSWIEHQKSLSLARFLRWNAFSLVSDTGRAFATHWKSIGPLFDRSRLHLISPSNELSSRTILWENGWGMMLGM